MDLAFDLSDHPQVSTAAVHAWFSDLSQCTRGPGIDAYFKTSASPLRNGDCRVFIFFAAAVFGLSVLVHEGILTGQTRFS